MDLLKSIFKAIGYLLYYILPIIFCVVAFFLGGIVGNAAFDGFSKWEAEQKSLHTHTLTIYWDETGTQTTYLNVRDDLEWNISGYGGDYGLYYSNFTSYADIDFYGEAPAVLMPSQSQREGYKFMGLYTSPYGGTQFVNAAGYSVREVTMDIVLYALWQRVN